jgi:nitroimidazol reductase NimA-like FMN-containing flavoprotein (pyridoxamine 5'-phosphate oxidase superfamily)
MRRKDREITNKKAIEAILKKADICHLSFNDKSYPYVVPMNFGYKDGCLYFHSATEGRKLDLIKKNGRAAFEISVYDGPHKGGAPCGWNFSYRCVMGVGKIRIIKDPKLKRKAVDILIKHYSKAKYKLLPSRMNGMVMLRLDIQSMTGKGNRSLS